MNDEKKEFETISSVTVPKVSKANKQVGSHVIDVKSFDGNKFIQITQNKDAFGNPNSPKYKPASSSSITLDPKNKKVMDAIAEAYKQ